jgi:Family of unknown function (DUF5302)
MTETAKQDTTKAPAETAETGSAATESAATQGEAKKATATAPAQDVPDNAAGAGEPAQPDLDETKRKFREALERKHQAHNEGQGRGGRDGGKINGAHGPAASRRNFRRKSG